MPGFEIPEHIIDLYPVCPDILDRRCAGIAWDQDGKGHAFIQILDGSGKKARYHRFSPEHFTPAAHQIAVSILDHSFSDSQVKLDVEGAEYEILFDCPKEILARVRYIVMEYHEFQDDRRSRRDLVALLQSHGFHVVVDGGIFLQEFLFGTGIIKAWRD